MPPSSLDEHYYFLLIVCSFCDRPVQAESSMQPVNRPVQAQSSMQPVNRPVQAQSSMQPVTRGDGEDMTDAQGMNVSSFEKDADEIRKCLRTGRLYTLKEIHANALRRSSNKRDNGVLGTVYICKYSLLFDFGIRDRYTG